LQPAASNVRANVAVRRVDLVIGLVSEVGGFFCG
jgi:hypothetical protein